MRVVVRFAARPIYQWGIMAAILVVEDDIFTSMGAVWAIEDLGYQTFLAADVDEALWILRSDSQLDALFTDIRLKSSIHGGYEVARMAVEIRPGLPVLYASGNSLADAATGLVLEGAHFLPKPYSEDQLKISIKKMLGAGL